MNQIAEGIFTVSGLLTPDECRQWIETAEAAGFGDAPIDGSFGPEVRKEIRNNDRAMMVMPAESERLWLAAKEHIPCHYGDWHAVGVNECLRFYRYDIGQRFEWHHDGMFRRSNQEHSKLTYMIYLNDGFEGGETSFAGATVTPAAGLALFFLHHLRHKGQPVTRGRKYVLRTDVMYRLQSKSDQPTQR
jgi:predicted 2-oxoglutarate/Fe(II)-dependent dioxygenase YbiX